KPNRVSRQRPARQVVAPERKTLLSAPIGRFSFSQRSHKLLHSRIQWISGPREERQYVDPRRRTRYMEIEFQARLVGDRLARGCPPFSEGTGYLGFRFSVRRQCPRSCWN